MKAILAVDALPNGTMDVTKLEAAVEQAKAEGLIPFAIVGTAGTTDHGAIDDLVTIADVAEARTVDARGQCLWWRTDPEQS